MKPKTKAPLTLRAARSQEAAMVPVSGDGGMAGG